MSNKPAKPVEAVNEASAAYRLQAGHAALVKPGYKMTEVGCIPDDWEATPFVTLGIIIDGDRGANYPCIMDFVSDGHCLFLNAGNVTKVGFRFSECSFISRDKDERLSKGKLKRDDIVLTTRGTVGNFAHFDSAVPFEHIRINSGMVILRKDSFSLDTKFLYALLQSRLVEQQIERLIFGSAQPQLTVKGISKVVIVAPPISEQRAIAAALSDVDALLDGLERLIAKKRDLKQAAMQQLLTGQIRLPGFSGEWDEKRLGDIADVIDPHPSHRAPDEIANGVPFVGIGDLDESGNIVGNKVRLVSATVLGEHASRYDLNDELIGLGRVASIGKVVSLKKHGDGYAISPTLGVIRGREAKRSYLLYALKSKFVTDQFTKIMSGSTRSSVGMEVLRLLKIQIPPSEKEQTAIATILSDMDAELAALEVRRDKTRALKQGMMQELLTGKTRLL